MSLLFIVEEIQGVFLYSRVCEAAVRENQLAVGSRSPHHRYAEDVCQHNRAAVPQVQCGNHP